ncbi:MAG: hypothetical protein GX847_12395, partial [Clostridiales bacterium]|nr:hypothetical protein [Clostridiales bacterium]
MHIRSIKPGMAQKSLLRKLPVLFLILALFISVGSCSADVSTAEATPPDISDTAPETGGESAQQDLKAGTAEEAEPPVRKITVTFYGDAATSRGFTWYTDKTSQASDLQVAAYSKEEAVFSSAMTFTGTVSDSNNSKDEFVHKAVATGLDSNATYYYKVGDASLDIW